MAAESASRTHPSGEIDEGRRKGQRDDDRGADVIERCWGIAQQSPRAGQGVGGAEAGQGRGQPQSVDRGGDNGFEGDRSTEAQSGR